MSSVYRLERVVKWLLKSVCIAAALFVVGWLVYVGNTHTDKVAPSMLAPTMCVLTALCLLAATFAMIFRSSEA